MNTLTKHATAGLVALGLSGTGLAFAQTASESPSETAATTSISFEEALAIAREAQPGSVEEIERDREDGVTVFEVEIETADGEVEVMIDATTGEVLEIEAEDDEWGFWPGHGDGEKQHGRGQSQSTP
jgi:uncharacterized iron-regulated membrane protein